VFAATYNGQHRPTQTVGADGQATTYGHNPRGQVTSIINANSETTTFSYDENGYLIKITGPVSAATTSLTGPTTGQSISYTYDNLGRRTSWTTSAGTELYQYDSPGSQISEEAYLSSTLLVFVLCSLSHAHEVSAP
jgi:YD repeat-containing protein